MAAIHRAGTADARVRLGIASVSTGSSPLCAPHQSPDGAVQAEAKCSGSKSWQWW